ncbi:MAG: DNA mismatch repair endonuclease MutL [Candidatus Binatia bacterium]
MGRIAILPPLVQGQIAAGEVIERPASVVKELVENALDAGARRIDVRLAAGGLGLIAVRDDGEGMSPEDAVLAFARHATSKLVGAADLPAVSTLGFRGEALPSIAAVARVRLVTRRAGDAAAVAVEAAGELVRGAGPTGAAPGTTIEVHDLFATVPARRKFMRVPATEVGHVVDVLTRAAVAFPEVGFRLEHDGREVLSHPPVASLRQRLGQVLGATRAAGLVEVDAIGGAVGLAGYVGAPRETLSSPRLLWTYVRIGRDGAGAGAARWIRDRLLLRAVMDGYESLVMKGRYPVAVLFLTLPPGEVDVNVHPAKLEVRFRTPTVIHQLIAPAVRRRLAAALKPLGPSAAPIDPAPEGAGESRPAYGLVAETGADQPRADGASAEWGAPPAEQGALWRPAPEGFATLRFVGQIFDGYLLCEGAGRVVLIDQHAAHERVVFERLRRERAAAGVGRDALLVPETVAVTPAEHAALAEHGDVLAAAGLEGEPFGDGVYLLRTVPRLLRGQDAGALLRAVAHDLAEEGVSTAPARAADALLATVACHSAVRVGQHLDDARVRALLAAMDEVDVNAHCPHGRPVTVELGRGQIESLFRR